MYECIKTAVFYLNLKLYNLLIVEYYRKMECLLGMQCNDFVMVAADQTSAR